MTSDDPDTPSTVADRTDDPCERVEYTDELADRSEMDPTPIDDWEEDGVWDDLDASELENGED